MRVISLSLLAMAIIRPDMKNVLKVPLDYLQARVTVLPRGSMTLYGRRDLPLVEARMISSATAELREDSSMVKHSEVDQSPVNLGGTRMFCPSEQHMH